MTAPAAAIERHVIDRSRKYGGRWAVCGDRLNDSGATVHRDTSARPDHRDTTCPACRAAVGLPRRQHVTGSPEQLAELARLQGYKLNGAGVAVLTAADRADKRAATYRAAAVTRHGGPADPAAVLRALSWEIARLSGKVHDGHAVTVEHDGPPEPDPVRPCGTPGAAAPGWHSLPPMRSAGPTTYGEQMAQSSKQKARARMTAAGPAVNTPAAVPAPVPGPGPVVPRSERRTVPAADVAREQVAKAARGAAAAAKREGVSPAGQREAARAAATAAKVAPVAAAFLTAPAPAVAPAVAPKGKRPRAAIEPTPAAVPAPVPAPVPIPAPVAAPVAAPEPVPAAVPGVGVCW